MESVKRENVREPGAANEVDTVIDDFQQRAMTAMQARDEAGIKTVLDACVDRERFDIVALILANFPEEFRGYVLSEISEKNPQAALDLYGKTELQDYFKALKNEPAFVIAAKAGDHAVVGYCLKAENPPALNACDHHMPVLHAAVESGKEIVVRMLLKAGADINLTYRQNTALSIAMNKNNKVLVSILLSDQKFNWLKNALVLDTFESYLRSSNDATIAKDIVRIILENIGSIGNPTEISQLLIGQTPLSLAIQLDRNVAGKLIEQGIGVFDLNADGNTPSYCIAQARDEGLMAELKSYYARHCSEITTLFLNSDPRIFKPLMGRSSCTLVLPLVNDWLELKQGVFDELSHRVENAHTTCAELKKIRDQINNPKGPLMQFFGIGHGAYFWQSKSPWPEKLEPLLNTIQARWVQAYSVVPISQITK